MVATIKDVAKMADVSISTVSRVINDSKPVSPEARRRVLHAIEVLDYRPNEVARSLVTKKSNLIGVIVDDIGSMYVSYVLRGVEEIGRMYNYDIILLSSYGDPELELKFAKLLFQKQVEGAIIISSTLNQKLMYRLEESRIPYANINRFYDIEEDLTVRINYEEVSFNMVEYLIEQGHKKIASLAIRKDIDRTEEKYKVDGYESAMKEHSLKSSNIYTLGIDEKSFLDISDEIDSAIKNGVTAFFCSQDEIALHLMNYLVDRGMKIPDDISVTGFGGTAMTNIYRPKLTTVRIPYYDIGAVAIRRILKKIEDKDNFSEERILLPVEILKRDSVKKID
ncbi:transcriptional regulator, LacI family [Anaerosphaera aminiphila DSM 21120]|uniref:Transcriptional regulator, LacI family n=1 Tax=Anaerosphaera aminiphila DSM 21120 TaxID=1120995 RepID=A0A1M5V4I6_9FIRM|nr:LacI family DNA-binding transcriptional regulator [Anaerosphaera aminiphila]SHH70141.1 transcriptional regulator, LacI family [Anaerosphaera aminiphila DSM 21120]